MKKTLLILCIAILRHIEAEAQQILTLQECRAMAIENNKDIKIQAEQIIIAENMKKYAFTQHLPNISGMGSYIHNSQSISLLSEDKFAPIGTIMEDGYLDSEKIR